MSQRSIRPEIGLPQKTIDVSQIAPHPTTGVLQEAVATAHPSTGHTAFERPGQNRDLALPRTAFLPLHGRTSRYAQAMLSEEQEGLEATVPIEKDRGSGNSAESRNQESWPSGQGNLRPLALHDMVGPFELVDFLGRGGMGQVYKARDTRLDRIIALKVLLPEPEASEERFQREARAQAKIDHEGVCRVYEVGTSEGRAYIAMQFLDGQTLAEMAEELTLEEKVSVLHQVAEAVQAAHRQALVHRDLKPSNIMVKRVDEEVKAWVLDFGMVQMAGDSRLTLTGEVVGTPLYMAPEQVQGEVNAIDRRTDVYSLGAILYELLTGRPPITGKSILEVLGRISLMEPVPPRQLSPNLPEDLEWITLRCLEKKPGRRYASARALIEDLESFRAGEPVHARQSTLRYHLSKKVRKHRRLLMVAGLLITLLAGVFWRDLEQRRDAAQATRLTAKFLRQVEQIEWRTRLMAALPRHDTRPETNTMLAELEALEREVEASGKVAKGPGLFALGRGYHVLGELDRGLEYLEQAWENGNRDPMLSFDLGLAYGEKYRERLRYARLAADPEVQEQARHDAALRYKQPAVEHFQRARQKGAGDSAWAEALLATYEERSDAALAALEEADTANSWRYETHVLRSNIWHDRANRAARQRDFEEAREHIGRAAEALSIARSIGESDSRVHAALCEINTTRISISEDERVVFSGGRQALLEPCLQAIETDSGSVSALTLAAEMANQLAVLLLWFGDGEAKSLFEQSTDWAQRAVAMDPETIQAANLLTRNFANLSHFSESPEERDQILAKTLELARRAVEIAPMDLEAALSLVDIASGVASEASPSGEDVETLFEEAAAVLEPLLQHPSPPTAVLACHASLENKRATWYLAHGGDAEGAIARAKTSLAALEPAQALDDYELFIMVELCSTEAYLSAAKDEFPSGLAACQDLLAEQIVKTPDDLEWALLDADLSILAVQLDPTQREVLKPRMETLLQRLRESEIYSTLAYHQLLGTWKLQLARLAEGDERIALLEESIDALTRSTDSTEDLRIWLSKIDTQLYLAEIERRRQRPEAARRLLADSRQDLAAAMGRDAQWIRLQLLQTVADSIEARLENPTAAKVESPTEWDSLVAQPYLRSETLWWRALLESPGRSGKS